MKSIDLIRLRLHNQGVSDRRFEKPEEVVRWLGAVQAQDYAGSLWALGLRAKNTTVNDIERALANGAIIRTWLNRGTLHYVSPDDVHWILDLLGPRLIARNARRLLKNYSIDEVSLLQSRKAILKALEGGRQLTRLDLYKTLEQAGVSTVHQRGLQISWRLALEGLICFGPRWGKQPVFVLQDEWAPRARKMEKDEAAAELAKRYFTSHGPATLQDFAWWSGLPVSDAQAALDHIQPGLERESIENQTYWFSGSLGDAERSSPDVHLLPPFDEYIVAYTDRKEILDPAYIGRPDFVNSYANPTLIVGGRIVGTWKRVIKKEGVDVWLNPFIPLNEDQKHSFGPAIRLYGSFLGLPVLS